MKFQSAQEGGDTTEDEFEVLLDELEPASEEPAKPAEFGRGIKVLIPEGMEYEVDDASVAGWICFTFQVRGVG